LETGNRDATSYVLQQNRVNFMLTTPLHEKTFASEHLKLHGDGVRDIAFQVEDCDHAFNEAVKRGAKPFQEPRDITDENGTIRYAAIHTYGDTIHSLISYKDYKGPFLPHFSASEMKGKNIGIQLIDHIVGNVELGKMNHWADFYSDVLGFHRYITFDDQDISTEYSALMSIVMSDGGRNIKFPINEPAEGKGGKSQIQEYIDYYKSAGVQHVALLCKDILKTVAQLQKNGVEFLRVPDEYYEEIPERVGEIDENIEDLKRLGLLVDRDDEGYLLQIFTKPVEDRPTVFYEILQRKGCKGFGKGNFKALFVSIEEEQRRRGNL
jgi:4-hydroxyphenylpyruvate dioxygenase